MPRSPERDPPLGLRVGQGTAWSSFGLRRDDFQARDRVFEPISLLLGQPLCEGVSACQVRLAWPVSLKCSGTSATLCKPVPEDGSFCGDPRAATHFPHYIPRLVKWMLLYTIVWMFVSLQNSCVEIPVPKVME